MIWKPVDWEGMEQKYLIYRRDFGPGLNSLISGIVGHLLLANRSGYLPVVDLANYPSVYQEEHPINGTKNVWEYYFEPVSKLTLEEIYRDQDYVNSGGGYPHEIVNSLITKTPEFLGAYSQWVKLNPSTQEATEKALSALDINENTLGVHFRGGDMRRTKNHPMPPSFRQMSTRIDLALESQGFDSIHVVTEHEDYLSEFRNRYGNKLKFLDVARYGRHEIYREYVRPNHRYLLGLEVLVETQCLARAGGLISGYSGVSEMAETLSAVKYRHLDKVWNGRLPFGGNLGERFWNFRANSPRILGGFGL